MTVLELDNLYDIWIVDFGVTNYMSNKSSNIFDLEQFASPNFDLVANRNGSYLKGKGKIKLIYEKIMSNVLYVLSFPF
jgi:hypothetical protein